jgi:hypothetical protein
MGSTVWAEPVLSVLGATATASPAIAAALTDISPYQQVIPANKLVPGSRVRIRAAGNMVTSAATATLVQSFYMNGETAAFATTPAILCATAAVVVPNTGSVAWPWEMDYYGIMLGVSASTGTSASIRGRGKSFLPSSVSAFSAPQAMPITTALATVAQTATALDTRVNQNIFVTTTLNVTTGVTSITCEELTVEILG